MKQKDNIFISSYNELKKVRTLTTCAMLISLSIILGYFTVNIGGIAKVGFSSIPATLAAFLFGPAVAGAFGAVADITKYLIKPDGAFFIGFTLNAILTGFIRGSILYKKELNIWRVIVSELIVTILCNLLINTYLISVLQGKAFIGMLPVRLIKNLISLPVNVVVFYTLAKAFLPLKAMIYKEA